MDEISKENIKNNSSSKNLLSQLKENIEEINSLKEKVESLEKKNSSLNNKIYDLKIQNKLLSEIDAKNKSLLEEKKICKQKIEELKSEILNVTKKEKAEKRLIEKELESEVILYKGLHESSLAKVHAAEKIINLNNFQNHYIQHLENEIQKLRDNSDQIISKLKLEHDIHFYNLKQRMIDCLMETQHNAFSKYKNDLEYNSKLNMIYKNQMLNEFEREAVLIKELIINQEKYEKLIFILKQDLIFQKDVQKDLLEKNNKYFNIIKSIRKKHPNNIIIQTDSLNKKSSLSERKKKKINKYRLNYLSKAANEEIKQKQEQITEKIIKNNIYRESLTNKNYHSDKVNKNYFEENISLRKLIEELYKENLSIKEQLVTLKDKQKMIYNKFNGILNLYRTALNFLSQDKDLKQNNIILTKDDIEKGSYDNFTPFQKYIIVMFLIKHLLPLIESSIEDNDELISIYNSFPNLNFKTIPNTFKNNNILSRLSKFNFRSVFDKKIDIVDSNIIDFNHRNINLLKNNKTLKTFNSDSNINKTKIKQIQKMLQNKSFNDNKQFKIFKTIKGKFRPIRFIHIENKFNFNFQKNEKDKDISLTRNYFFD